MTFNPYSTVFWVVFAVFLLAQNFSFTMVSRARNSGSLGRHVRAAILSNGIWICGQIFTLTALLQIITGKFGLGMQGFSIAFYTLFTVLGSITAHWYALRTEKGSKAVGSSKRYAQITKEEWHGVQLALDHLANQKVDRVVQHDWAKIT